ncbi:hypothetical protein LINPERPRIM_LOCUS854 [Linum perenne]
MPGTRCWDEELLEEMLPPDEVTAVLQVNVLTGEGTDRHIWHYRKMGEYTVKFAYKLYLEHLLERPPLAVAGRWKEL